MYETELRERSKERLRVTYVEVPFVIAAVQTLGDILFLTAISTAFQQQHVGI